jgi:hypothetical protein
MSWLAVVLWTCSIIVGTGMVACCPVTMTMLAGSRCAETAWGWAADTPARAAARTSRAVQGITGLRSR